MIWDTQARERDTLGEVVGMERENTENRETGDPGRTRTCNILIRSQVLYPVELRGRSAATAHSRAQCDQGTRRWEAKLSP